MNDILLHIPHANTHFPDEIGEVLVDFETLSTFSNQISDLKIDEIFTHGIGEKYIAPYSRKYCDIEKFINVSKEIMSKYGYGVLYTKDSKENEIRRVS